MRSRLLEELKNLVFHQKYLKMQRRLISLSITRTTDRIKKRQSDKYVYRVFEFQKVKTMALQLSLILQRHNISNVQKHLKSNAKKIQEIEASLKGR